MALLKIFIIGVIHLDVCENANHFITRYMGLMYALSKNNEILFIDRAVPPKKVRKKVKNGYKVLELCSGVADKLGLAEGDVLDFK